VLTESVLDITEVYEDLRTVLFNDSAVAGEAAGYAMGLVMLGAASQKALDEMLQYAHETQHEKIIRGLAMGISFLFYGKQQEADGIIETLASDQVRDRRRLEALRCGRRLTIGVGF
jgi:26S proteasome regulatory subunit N2